MIYLKCEKCGHATFINRVCFSVGRNGKIQDIQRGNNLYCEKCEKGYEIYSLEFELPSMLRKKKFKTIKGTLSEILKKLEEFKDKYKIDKSWIDVTFIGSPEMKLTTVHKYGEKLQNCLEKNFNDHILQTSFKEDKRRKEPLFEIEISKIS